MARSTHKRFPKTGIAVTFDGVTATMHYGESMGSREYKSLESLTLNALPWLEQHRKRLVAQAAEIEAVESYLRRMTART